MLGNVPARGEGNPMHDNTHVTPDPAYREAVERKRAEDDEYLRTAQDSPLLPEARAAFAGLPYFPVDEGWRLAGLVLQPYEGEAPVRFEMAATRGEDRPAVRAGTFRFEARGAEHRLVAYRLLGDDDEPEGLLFVPFMDATTGTDTYGAGRYLDAAAADDGTWTLDFNLAYHPYCAYNPRYSCPITPAENRLAIRLEVGERLAGGHA